ncbi:MULTISPECIES: ribonuclease HIII [Staphylococcus]|uniref:Ribonuclease HIII n=1 Tax=Staphylococcus pettenkoferi TaxID=170573 RepID=A0A2N6QKN1_9STAP|nr:MULTISPECIES: ribonuclease HIII [Staphylococcus]MBX8993421.1 ribonuclease HIII [Staphylococcus pettenkoferi]MCI2791339.1 ribonuclease HIII [Staphylococcus pettenkoferi]MCY1566488.1 ribonuclease HIII [Staphylococcus pettenkoferi]MCY1587888.1 ribonuclease HIII [Staphylococcus pettenkoferi]MCY1603506.1 ribonuclease HIII [Staphylococcus pettenkoferi]
MTNVVKKVTAQEINHLLDQLQFDTTGLPQGMKARKKHQGTTISVYNSNKVMFQGKNAEQLAQSLLPNASVQPKKQTAKKSKKPSHPQFNQYSCIGSDEAGSGDYFGPLTVCAAYVSDKNAQVLKTLGVDDSKKLTDDKIVELAEQLVTFIPHSLLVLDNPKYNERQAQGWSQVKMKAVLHNEAIKNVLSRIDSEELDYIVVDQFAQPGVYKRYALTDIPLPDKTHFETKGESKSIAIAAASIISRYAFVKHMDHISKQLNTSVIKGASKKVDLCAARIINRLGIAQLDQVTKKHFANRDKASSLVEQKRR